MRTCGSANAPSAHVTVTKTVSATPTAEATPSATDSGTARQLGLVWASQVDPARVNQKHGSQPEFDGGDGIKVRIENVIYVDKSLPGQLSEQCLDQLQLQGAADETHCLTVQWSFDVPSDYRADDAGLTPGPLLTPNGRQIEQGLMNTGVPGAKNVVMVASYPGGVPGSTLRFNVGSNERRWKTLKFKVPGAKRFIALTFD